ncbi:MAG: hypothetical protein HY020_20460, partial [Burkholderiales bacterium]|nr:hypothetical protein [Burkholderiales bacterium]
MSDLIPAAAGGLAYRVHQPAPAHPTALLVLLHGVGGNETNLADLATDLPPDTLVVLPRGRLTLGPLQHAWFRVAFTTAVPQIVAGEAEDSRLALIDFIGQLQAHHGIAPSRTVVAGFSQGGILSASVALSAPERVQGFAVLSGRLLPELEPVIASPERLRHLRGLITHGRDDDKLPVSWAERADAWLTQLRVAHELKLYPGGHGLTAAAVQDFRAWLQAVMADATLLQLDADATRLGTVHIAPGLAALQREHLTGRPLAYGIESAIAVIEDELALVPRALHGTRVQSRSPALREIAQAAGLASSATEISRDAVEQVYARQAAVAMGRPAAAEQLPYGT